MRQGENWGMPESRTIRRRAYLRFLRWMIVMRFHRGRTAVAFAFALALVVMGFGGRYLVDHLPVWVNRMTRPVFHAMQAHPHVAKLMHVLINAIPDVAYALLALAGLAYLMPEVTAKLEKNKARRIFLFTLFALMGSLAIFVNAVNRTDQEDKDKTQSAAQAAVLGSVIDIQNTLHSNKTLTEAQRKEALLNSLRDEYIITHNPIDPDIVAKTKMPPDDWMNARLQQIGEDIRVATAKAPPAAVIQQVLPEPKKANVEFGFYTDAVSDNITDNLIALRKEDSSVIIPITFRATGDVTAHGLHIWLRVCDQCTWKEEPVAPGVQVPDTHKPADRDFIVGDINPGPIFRPIDLHIGIPNYATSIPIAGYFTCDNCPPGNKDTKQELTFRVTNPTPPAPSAPYIPALGP